MKIYEQKNKITWELEESQSVFKKGKSTYDNTFVFTYTKEKLIN